MTLHIIIDGYNMIRQSLELSYLDRQDIQLGRDVLIKRLGEYKKSKGHKITVVFDGIDMPSIYQQRDKRNGIEIRFSTNNESADGVIAKLVSQEKNRAIVVSCDRAVLSFAESCDASIIDSTTFERKMNSANSLLENETEFEQHTNRHMTHKKGPRKRLSKRKRKQQIKINKL